MRREDDAPRERAWMGWVVKSWNAEALEELVAEQARAAAAEIVADADRDARRSSRAAARETADALAYLEALETFGVLTRRLVRERRGELRSEPPPAEYAPSSAAQIRDEVVAHPRRITARHGRATLRESPLTELFRATA